MRVTHEEPRVERLRRLIEESYLNHPTGCGGSFGEILCWELHSNGQTFIALAGRWGVSLSTLGELIYDHCKRLEDDPVVAHKPKGPLELHREAYARRLRDRWSAPCVKPAL